MCSNKREQSSHKRAIRIIVDYLLETFETRRAWKDVIHILKGNNCQHTLLYPEKLSFKFEGENRLK